MAWRLPLLAVTICVLTGMPSFFEIDDALIDSLIEGIRTYLGTLKSIVGYSVSLDYDYDLVDAFSKGQVPIVYDYTPKLPAERITNTSVMTRKYLVNLAKGAN